jgi:uncharacterized membrane protein
MWAERNWRTGAVLLATIVLLAGLVSMIVYAFEARLGGLAYVLGQAVAVVVAISLIAWIARRSGRQKKRQ